MDTNTIIVTIATLLIVCTVCTLQTFLGSFGQEKPLTIKQRIITFPEVLWDATFKTPYVLVIVIIALAIIMMRRE